MKRSLLISLVTVVLAAVVHAAERPNVLFIFSDDQRADTIAALGNTHVTTPNLDRLVRAGTAFTRAYCMGAQQGAVCVPSRAMLMSGRTLFRIKENLEGQGTWPEEFREQGYATFLTGKWHNGAPAALRSFAEGKAIFLGGMGDPYKLKLHDISKEHTLVNPRESGEHSVKLFADSAIEFIRGQKGVVPFLCYVAFNAPHDPRVAPAPYHTQANANQPPAPANFLPQHPFNNGALTIRDEQLAPWPRTPEIVRQHLADYHAYIRFMDDQIGRILEALKASGQYDNTIIVFSSDHGLAIGSHGLFGKQNLYDHSMHAPLIIGGAGLPKDKRADGMCYLLDIFPTLGDLCGVEGPAGSEGTSLVPVLFGKKREHRDAIFTAYTKVQRAVRDDRWKLIVYPQINLTQLFDLQTDPNELNNLASSPAHAAQVKRMLTLLKQEQQRAADGQALTTDKPEPREFDFSKVKASKNAKATE